MYIDSLKLRAFRNYPSLELTPHPGVNILFGQNGSGKTNLLEAIHYCALGRSHRTSQDREVVQKGADMGAVGVRLHKGRGQMDIQVKLTPNEARKKAVYLDRKRAGRLSDLMGHVQCVIFSPEDLQLVKEGPSVRRRYLDMLISQMSQVYFTALQQYQKALDERNALIRDIRKGLPVDSNELTCYEQIMADQCEMIIPFRRRILEQTARIATQKYRAISGRANEQFAMRYVSCTPDNADVWDYMTQTLRKGRRDDAQRGTTTFGIHREDITLTLNGRDMKVFASQGQIRTAALSMKLAQLEVFSSLSDEMPILLLDDVMSELDMSRRTRLLEEINGVQTFITCTDESDLVGSHEFRSYHVRMDDDGNGRVYLVSEGEAYQPKTPATADLTLDELEGPDDMEN